MLFTLEDLVDKVTEMLPACETSYVKVLSLLGPSEMKSRELHFLFDLPGICAIINEN